VREEGETLRSRLPELRALPATRAASRRRCQLAEPSSTAAHPDPCSPLKREGPATLSRSAGRRQRPDCSRATDASEEGPVVLANIAPHRLVNRRAPTRTPRTGRGCLSYRRAAELFRAATGGWTLHELRHSRLTHLAEAGVTGPLLMDKSRHGSVKTLATYTPNTFGAVAEGPLAWTPPDAA
jgi:integrase